MREIRNRGQAWGMDVMIGAVLFFFAFIIFYFYAINSVERDMKSIEEIRDDGAAISDLILSDGEPHTWNSTFSKLPGIMSAGKVNQTKLDMISDIDYERLKAEYRTRNNFYFNFSQPLKIRGVQTEYIGKKDTSSSQMIVITRYVIYDNKPAVFKLYMWS